MELSIRVRFPAAAQIFPEGIIWCARSEAPACLTWGIESRSDVLRARKTARQGRAASCASAHEEKPDRFPAAAPVSRVCYNCGMEDQELRQRFDAIEGKIDAVYRSAEKTRTYILWTAVVTIALIVLPAIGLVFAVPSLINTLNTSYVELGGL